MDAYDQEKHLANICSEIGIRFGANVPSYFDYDYFKANKEKVFHDVASKKHFHQDDWPDCVNILYQRMPKAVMDQPGIPFQADTGSK